MEDYDRGRYVAFLMNVSPDEVPKREDGSPDLNPEVVLLEVDQTCIDHHETNTLKKS